MADRPDKDELEQAPRPPSAPKTPSAATAALPVAEPGDRSHDDVRKELQVQVDELEGALRYMGTSHPQRDTTEKRLAQLKAMLGQMDGG